MDRVATMARRRSETVGLARIRESPCFTVARGYRETPTVRLVFPFET
jgi:hypothetical protein